MRPLIEELARLAPVAVSVYPNAGLPDPLLPTGFGDSRQFCSQNQGLGRIGLVEPH